ncbi:hypothetical protein BgiBS90_035526, partial [Biomphalaria glabrata]
TKTRLTSAEPKQTYHAHTSDIQQPSVDKKGGQSDQQITTTVTRRSQGDNSTVTALIDTPPTETI